MMRRLVRSILDLHDDAAYRLRAYVAAPVVTEPEPTIADAMQRRLADDERQRSEAEARRLDTERRIAELEAKIAEDRADAERLQAERVAEQARADADRDLDEQIVQHALWLNPADLLGWRLPWLRLPTMGLRQ